MCIASCRWVLGCLCIELLLGLSSATGAVPGSAERRALELELALAGRPEVYLLVDCELRELQVKARGLVLHRTPILGLALVRVPPSSAAALELPGQWNVERTTRGGYRRIIAPVLAAAADSETGAADRSPPAPEEPSPVELEPTAAYLVELSEGWLLEVGPESTAPSLVERLRWGARSLWRRGEDSAPRPQIRLRLAPADARRLFHLLRPGVRLLVVP